MRFLVASFFALSAVAACSPSIPDSAAGVGFDNVDGNRRAAVDARLEGRAPSTAVIPPAASVSTSTLGPQGSFTSAAATASAADDSLEADAMAALRAANSGQEPLQASPSNPPPQVVSNSVGISNENDFDAVSDERSIQADAALRAQNQAAYQVIQPTALPTREGATGPNIVDYALRTTNVVGQSLYRRSTFASKAKEERNCAAYASPDLAQEAFLASGGPEKDREGLDSDGDGFACTWNPAPFRAVRSSN